MSNEAWQIAGVAARASGRVATVRHSLALASIVQGVSALAFACFVRVQSESISGGRRSGIKCFRMECSSSSGLLQYLQGHGEVYCLTVPRK